MSTEEKFTNLLHTITQLVGDKGCPWDKKQTNDSMIKYLRSETDELIEGLQNKDIDNICEELGDLFFVLLLTTSINERNGDFDLSDVLERINKKLIRRHPHVFEGTTYDSEEDLVKQWNRIKEEEKAAKACSPDE